MEKWSILFSKEAQGELEKAILAYPDLKQDILARLKVLEKFPPEKWFFISKHKGMTLFRAETGQIIRVSGEADRATKTVRITHVVIARKRN